MKTKIKPLAYCTTLAASLAILTGCASSGYDKGNQTAENIQAAADTIAALPGQLDQTLASLNDLIEKPQGDLRPQFKQFSANLAGVESTAKDIAAARRTMGENQKEFFAKWDEQLALIKNEDIKARSQSRKEEVTQNLLAIKRSYLEAETAFKPFLSDLKDVQKYLSVDLTAGGVSAIKGTVAKANQDEAPLKTSINQLAADFKTLGLSMSSVTPPPAK